MLIYLFVSGILLVSLMAISGCRLLAGFNLPLSSRLFIFRVEFNSSSVAIRLSSDLRVPSVDNRMFDFYILDISCGFLGVKVIQMVPQVLPERYLSLVEYEHPLLAVDFLQTQRQGRPVAVRYRQKQSWVFGWIFGSESPIHSLGIDWI